MSREYKPWKFGLWVDAFTEQWGDRIVATGLALALGWFLLRIGWAVLLRVVG